MIPQIKQEILGNSDQISKRESRDKVGDSFCSSAMIALSMYSRTRQNRYVLLIQNEISSFFGRHKMLVKPDVPNIVHAVFPFKK